MTSNDVAIAISIFAVFLSGLLVLFTFFEQRHRLRPTVYLHKPEQFIAEGKFNLRCSITNVGLLPAKDGTISTTYEIVNSIEAVKIVSETGGIKAVATPRKEKLIIVPKQTVDIGILELTPKELGQSIIEGKITLRVTIEINYKSGRRKFHYWIKVEFNPMKNNWTYLDGDAN